MFDAFGDSILFFKNHAADLLVGFILLLIGYMLTVASRAIRSFFVSRRIGDISGNWVSYWDANEGRKTSWVQENIVFKRKILGGYKIIAENNSNGYEWFGKGDFKSDYIFLGKWQSITYGSKNEGVVILLRCSEGKSLFGHWYGFSGDTVMTIGQWLMVPKGVDPIPQVKRHLTGICATKLVTLIGKPK